jgi:hypothetical protein
MIQGCTTVGECNNLNINTDQSGATYIIYDKNNNIINTGTTPATVSLYKMKAPYIVRLSQEYKETKEFIIKRKFRPAYLGNVLLVPVAFTGVIGLILDPATKINPNSIKTNLEYTPEGLIAKKEKETKEAEEREKEYQEHQRQLYEFVKNLTNEDNINVKYIEHIFNISNPYAFDKNTVYYSTSDYLYVHQWMEEGFIGSFLPEEASLQMPYNSQFYIRNAYNLRGINYRVSNVYIRYIGTQSFTRGNRSTVILPVFDLLYYN